MSSSGIDIVRPNISRGESSKAIAFPRLFDIFWAPSVPTRSGTVSAIWGSMPRARIRSRPTRRLSNWSCPPSSTSASMTTES